MSKRLFIGKLPYETRDEQLRELFESNGFVISFAQVIIDRETQRSKGFGFVELENDDQLEEVLNKLNGYEMETNRGTIKIVVNEARPKEEGAPRGGNFGGPRNNGGFSDRNSF